MSSKSNNIVVPDPRTLQIIHYPDDRLRDSAGEIDKIDDTIVSLAQRMAQLMEESQGIGLAAPQVGLPLRLIVVSLNAQAADAQAFINPQLSNFNGNSEIEEGCLSVPGVRAKVKRYATCTLNALDIKGNAISIDADDLLATVFQHETDHLKGALFIDKISPVARIGCRRAIKRLEKEFKSA